MHYRAIVLALMAAGAVPPVTAHAADDCTQMFVYSVNQFCRTLANGFSQCQPVGMVGPAPNCAMPGVPPIMPVPLAPPVTQAVPPYNFATPFPSQAVAPQVAKPTPQPIAPPVARPAVAAIPAPASEKTPTLPVPVLAASTTATVAPAPAAPTPSKAPVAATATPVPVTPAATVPVVAVQPAPKQDSVASSPAAPLPAIAAPTPAMPAKVATPAAPAVVTTPAVVTVAPVASKPPLAEPVHAVPAAAQATAPIAPAPVSITLEDGLAHFDFNRAELSERGRAELDAWLKQPLPKGKSLRVTGHADRLGPAAYNLKLSGRRAETVKQYLVGKGMEASVVQVVALPKPGALLEIEAVGTR